MATHNVEDFADDQLSVPGHTALVTHNHNTGAQSLGCDDCGVHLGRFVPDRWREKHIREAWKKHLEAWCEGIRNAEPGPDGRHVAARCGSTSTHAGHWLDGRDDFFDTATREA